jgi:hypothetical protein
MSVEKDTPKNERLPTDLTALLVVLGGVALALNAFSFKT